MPKHFDVARLKTLSENILELDSPDSYKCRVYRYEQGHSVLTISAAEKNAKEWKPIYIKFEDVSYFEGTMWWVGANFCTAPIAEYIDLLSRFEDSAVANAMKELVSVNGGIELPGRLFIFKTDSIAVKVIASFLTVTDEVLH